MSLKIRFRFDVVHIIRATTPSATDIHPMGSVKGVSLCTFFTFTKIAKRRAEDPNLVVVRASTDREEHKANDAQPSSQTGAES
jgi:hypothetical protein